MTVPLFMAVSGEVRKSEVVDLLNCYMEGAGVVPPVFVSSGKCYKFGFSCGMNDHIRERMQYICNRLVINGEDWPCRGSMDI